jgi:ABC-2 type transport system ATP-binding protein
VSVLVERSGPIELTAIVAIVVATRGVMLWHQESGPRWKESFDRVRSPRDWSLTRREWALLAGGYLLLAVANYREALAIALVGDPELLILDEPSSGLDPNGVRLVREIARDHADRGKTVFFSSHILSQVEAVCDRVAILNRGRLVAIDSIDGLRDALGTGSTVTLTLNAAPDQLTLAELSGVSDVTVDDRTIRVSVDEATTKVDVIDRIRDDGAAILDVTIEESSLEDLFNAYTGDTFPPVEASEVKQ